MVSSRRSSVTSLRGISSACPRFHQQRLDYCNSLLAGVGDQLIGQLQSVLRAAARLVLQKKKFDRISDDIRNKLHWLPIRQRISFKLCLLVFRCLRGEAPPYLSEMLSPVSDSGALQSHRSAARGDLIIPRTFTKTFGPRGFAVSGPTAWNALPAYLKTKICLPQSSDLNSKLTCLIPRTFVSSIYVSLGYSLTASCVALS